MIASTNQRQEWEELAGLDPLWAILSFRRRKFGRWDHEAFFATGQAEVERLLRRSAELGRPEQRNAVLDVGCGVGRLAPALSAHFGAYCGVDISATMIGQARALHAGRGNCSFAVVDGDRLSGLGDAAFDLVISIHVLQHRTTREAILADLSELVRVLRPGGLLVVQLPGRIPFLEKAACDTRRRLYLELRRLGLPEKVAFKRLGLFPMTMSFLAEDQVVDLVRARGGVILHVERYRVGIAMRDHTYYVTTGP